MAQTTTASTRATVEHAELWNPRGRRQMASAYLSSLRDAFRERRTFGDVRTFCFFIGYPRSGHSLLGALLDAHPAMVIAHELDALRYLERHFGRRQIFSLILKRSRDFAGEGSRWHGYSYAVPGQWQGRFERLRVIGDKKGSKTSQRVLRDPSLLRKLERVVKADLRCIHMVRNPFDNIAAMHRWTVRRGSDDLDAVIDRYFERCAGAAAGLDYLGPERAALLHHEDFVAEPREHLAKMCEFLGVDAPEEYLRACASIVVGTPNKARHEVEWSDDQRAKVEDGIDRHPYLARYTFNE